MPEDLTYNDIPPHVRAYLSRPGVNKEKALQWFSLGISEPQTYNQAKLLAEAVGNSPEQAKVVAGQWQFESSGGSRVGANHNYFGIQAHSKDVRDRLSSRGINVGVGEDVDTPEIINGKKVSTKNKFMEFDNAFDGFQAHRVFLETNDRYKNALAAETAKDFAKELEQAGYATATNYGTTLYNDYVLPKEKSPMSGDTRPKGLGTTASKAKLGTSEKDQVPVIIPALPTAPVEMIQTETLGVRPEISTSPAQASYIPTNSAPVVMPESEAMKMTAPKGWFGSGKSTFNAMGGSLNNSGFNALPKEVQNKIRTNMNNKRFAEGGPMGQLTEFNAGGSHEENPLGGIPQGMNPDGGMNLVEENETKFKDYVYSDQIKITKDVAKELNLSDKLVGKTYAEASKKLNYSDSRREEGYDTIQDNASKKNLEKLREAQELQKQLEVQKKVEEIQALDPNALAQIAQSYQPQGMPPQGMAQGQPSPEEMAMMEQQGQMMDPAMQGQPPMDPAMMEQMMAQQQGAPQMPMQYGGPMSYKCGGGMYEYGGNLSRQFYDGGPMSGSNFGNGSATLNNPYAQNNGLNNPANNGLNNKDLLSSQGFRDFAAGTGAEQPTTSGNNGLSGGQYAQMGLSAVNAGANINRINKSDMSQDAKTSAYGDTASQIGDSTVQTIFPALAPAFAAKNAYQGMLTSNVNPETGEKAYKKGFQASSNEAVTPIHTRQIKGVTDFAKDKSAANFGKMAWNFMDPGSAQLFDSAKGIWGKDKYAENQTAIDLNQKSQEDAYNQQQLAAQQQQQNMINTAVQAGIAGYNQQPQDDINSNFAKYGGHQFSTAYPNFKNSAGPMGQPLTNLYNMGGNMNHYFDPGGPLKEEDIYNGPIEDLNPSGDEGLTGLEEQLSLLRREQAHEKYLNTPIENFKTEQDKLKTNYENREGLGAFAANMAPIAYNAYQGFLAPQMPLPENMAYQYDPYLQNINSQLRDADKMGAQAFAAARNMGNPGAVSAVLGNIASEITDTKSKIREAKENADNLAKTEAAKYNNKGKVDASLARWQLEAQMKNARAEAQKEAFTGIKDYSNMQTQNALASDYNAMAGEGNYTYENIPYLQGLQRTFAASQAARNKKKEDNKTV